MKSRVLYRLVFLTAMALAVYAGTQIFRQVREYRQGQAAYDSLDAYVETAKPTESGGMRPTEQPTDTQAPAGKAEEMISWPVVDFEALREINPDCMAWIQVPGTKISYPVVQGDDNSYYLKHLLTGEWNGAGCVFLDCRVSGDLGDRHSILYGHRMSDGTMFTDILRYEDQDYYEAHPTAYLMTPEGNYLIRFFSGYVVPADDEQAWTVDFDSDTAYELWLEGVGSKSCFVSGVTPEATDRVLTLSTCSFAFEDARFVLHGILRGPC